MGDGLHLTTRMAEEEPKFMALLCVGLLYKLAGQHTFNVKELHDYNQEFDGIRVAYTVATGDVTVTLHSAKGG